jgi:AAA family ATPase
MRPGRLDRLIYVGPPDAQGREEIFRIRTKSMSIAPDVDISVLVALVSASHNPKTEFLILMKKTILQTEGCSGAEIMAICQEAAMLTMQADINAPHVRPPPWHPTRRESNSCGTAGHT